MVAFEVPFEDVVEEEGKLDRIELTNSTKAVGVNGLVGVHVVNVAQSSV